jgi:hypothetical protein
MQLRIERRSEVALRSLSKIERKYIDRALAELRALDRTTLQRSPKLQVLDSAFSDKKFFVYKGSQRLRLLLSFDHETCVLEDIVDHDRLDRMVRREGQR